MGRVREKKAILLLFVLVFCVGFGSGCGEPSEAEIKRQKYRKKLESYVAPEVLATVDEEYFSYIGAYDHWRFPLVYPYSISMIDTTVVGGIEKTVLTRKISAAGEISYEIQYITHLAFDGKFMLAKVDPAADKRSESSNVKPFWLVFEFATGKSMLFSNEAEAKADAKSKGYSGSETLEELDAHYERTFH